MKCSAFLRILKKDGWYIERIKGSHYRMWHPIKKGVIVFPNHGSKELGKGLEHKLRAIAQIESKE